MSVLLQLTLHRHAPHRHLHMTRTIIRRFPSNWRQALFSAHIPASLRIDWSNQSRGSEGVLKENMEERAERLALYMIENRTTVRAAAQKFGISKSTVHKDISERLPLFNQPLYLQVKEVLDVNKAQRHIRGGIATRKKYRGE